MAQIEIKSRDGKVVGKHDLAKAIAEATISKAAIHRAVIAEEANSRQGTQSAKTRSEVRGGGRKPYKQKKTGNARQGSTRSPQYAHGAMALAVKPRDYDKKVNRKERRAALIGALAAKAAGGDLLVVDQILFTEPKTKAAAAMLEALGVAGERRVLIVLPQIDDVTYKCFRNLANVKVRTAPGVGETDAKTNTFSTRDLLIARKVVVAKDALARIEEAWSK